MGGPLVAFAGLTAMSAAEPDERFRDPGQARAAVDYFLGHETENTSAIKPPRPGADASNRSRNVWRASQPGGMDADHQPGVGRAGPVRRDGNGRVIPATRADQRPFGQVT
ncbi:hypothetical protein MyChFU_30240 [Mycobacterium intracellulare subsp. chimaera]